MKEMQELYYVNGIKVEEFEYSSILSALVIEQDMRDYSLLITRNENDQTKTYDLKVEL